MKVIDKLSLLDRIGRALQQRMSYREIDSYLKLHGVDVSRPTSGVNSKWVYSKELLAEEPDALILRIADELQVPHGYATQPAGPTVEATFWEPLHFRLFISHLSVLKKQVGLLQAALRPYGVTAFVAHVDIEPTREWLDEIEAGLYSMDALAAVLMPGFKESSWTDQEVGVAVGRGVLIVPVIRGLNPYGFISKYQGLNASGRTVAWVAGEMFRILSTSPRTRNRMLSCLVETTLSASSEDEGLLKLKHLRSVQDLPSAYLEKLREAASSSQVFGQGEPLNRLNELLASRGLNPVPVPQAVRDVDDDVPF